METFKSLIFNPQYLLYNLMYWLSNALYEPYLVLYMQTQGLSSTQTGVILSVMRVATVVGCFAIGYLADKTQNPKLALFLSSAGGIAAVILTGHTTYMLVFLLACSFYGFFVSPGLDLVDKLVVDNVKNGVQLNSLFRLFGSIGYSLGALIAGALVAKLQFSMMFTYCTLMTAGCMVLCFFMKDKKKAAPARQTKHVPLSKIFSNPFSYYLYGYQVLWGCIEGGALSYAALYVASQGLDATYTARFVSFSMLGQVVMFSALSFALGRKLKPHTMVALAGLAMGARVVSYACVGIFPMFLVYFCQFLGGFGYSLCLHAAVVMIAAVYPPDVSNTAHTLKSVFMKGIGSSLGALVFGYLYERVNPMTLMISSSGICVFLTVFSMIAFRLLKRRTTAYNL